MRIESSVTSLSWIPSEAITGLSKVPFERGVTHYDDPPPDVIEDLDALRRADRFRFANELRAWIDVDDDGRIVGHGHLGGGRMGVTKVRAGGRQVAFAAFGMPDLRPEPEVGDDHVRFVQTAGGRTALPAPRRVASPPFVKWEAPLVWTTLALTIRTDGTSEHELVGTSPFPRSWVYDDGGRVATKTGLIDFKRWYRHAFGKHSPWGDEDSPAVVAAAETALERELSRSIMRGGAKPLIRKVAAGETLIHEGEAGTALFLLLDGVVAVDVAGEPLGEMGPGAVFGERALVDNGARTSTVQAVTACKVAMVTGEAIDPDALAELSTGHRREDQRPVDAG